MKYKLDTQTAKCDIETPTSKQLLQEARSNPAVTLSFSLREFSRNLAHPSLFAMLKRLMWP
jgi:hypothetical protein